MPQYPHEKPKPPIDLKILTALQGRKILNVEEKQGYETLHKGYIGELKFYEFLRTKLPPKRILLSSLRLKSNNSEFQIDSLLVWENMIYLFEVKNFEGDYYIDRNNWYISPSGKEINNPLIQLKRSESLLRQLLQQTSYNTSIESFIVFNNLEFALFQAPIHLPIILPSQLHRFFDRLVTTHFTPTSHHSNLANFLVSNHIHESVYDRTIKYTYEQLKKGIKCGACRRFLVYQNRSKLSCHHCNIEEKLDEAVTRAVNDFILLFPERKITTKQIHEWCADIIPKKTIRRILSTYLTRVGNRQATYYVLEK